MEKQYYSVRIDKKSWTKETTTISEFEKRGFKVQDSRMNGDKDVFFDGRMVATLFENRIEAAKYALA